MNDETHEHQAVDPESPPPATPGDLRLRYSAISDVGRVRKDNQDSGYAGPWFLAVCDGVGGAVRGDIASSEALGQLRRIDTAPQPEDDGYDPLALVAGAIQRAHDQIADIVDHDPGLNGTSTTATVGLFTGAQLAIGHIGDSRAYRLRAGALTQLTKDHTFVQTLVDDGRITEEEAHTHPHRNVILKALDGSTQAEPDLFFADVAAGDRLLFCSDGVLSLNDPRIADILGLETPDLAAIELVRAALDAGSTDNVTCVVADVVPSEVGTDDEPLPDQPLLVGAAAELPRRRTPSARTTPTGSFFRSQREPEAQPLPPGLEHGINADPPIDPETARYAPRPPERFVWLRRTFFLLVMVGVAWMALAAAWSWSQHQYYVGEAGGTVTIYRGLNAEVPGIQLSQPFETSNVGMDRLSEYEAKQVGEGIDADSLSDARQTVANLAQAQGSS